MALPDFDDHGNLPPGRHRATLEETRSALVDPFPESHTRQAIFDWWCDLRAGLEDLGGFVEQWLAGSYVTSKQQPNDLDVVTVFDGPAFEAFPRHRQQVIQAMVAGHVTEALWRCDNYPVLHYPDDGPSAIAGRAVEGMWGQHFGQDRDGNERGFVVVAGD
jgi:hypothetical protein